MSKLKKLWIIIGVILISHHVNGQDCIGGFINDLFGNEPEKADTIICETPECLECVDGQVIVNTEEGYALCITVLRPLDPNEIEGPEGYGESRWVSKVFPLNYTVFFENDPKFATAAARRVRIEHELSPHVQRSSFTLLDFGFGPYIYEVPDNRGFYNTLKDHTETLSVAVDLAAGISEQTATWSFSSVDLQTGLEPRDVAAGFLPVNDSTGIGEGQVSFSVLPAPDTETGDSITATASIIFDDNTAIQTNTAYNLIDATPPTSTIDSLYRDGDSIHLNITATDAHSGLRDAYLYSIGPDSAYTLIDTLQAGTHTYTYPDTAQLCYVAFAYDNVGNDSGWQQENFCDNGEPNEDPFDWDKALSVYPNPSTGLYTIRVTQNLGREVNLRLLDMSGKQLYSKVLPPGLGTYIMDLRHLASGVYILLIIDGEDGAVRRLVKE